MGQCCLCLSHLYQSSNNKKCNDTVDADDTERFSKKVGEAFKKHGPETTAGSSDTTRSTPWNMHSKTFNCVQAHCNLTSHLSQMDGKLELVTETTDGGQRKTL